MPDRTPRRFGITEARTWLWPSWCCRPSPFSVVRPAVAPRANPLPRASPKAQKRSPGSLKSEHGIENIKRDHGLAVRGIACSGRSKAGGAPGFGDSLFQYLPVLRFVIAEQHSGIHRFIDLPHRRVDAEFPEHGIHAESPRFIRDDRHNAPADFLVAHQHPQQPDKSHRGGNFPACPGPEFELVVQIRRRHRKRFARDRHAAAANRPSARRRSSRY